MPLSRDVDARRCQGSRKSLDVRILGDVDASLASGQSLPKEGHEGRQLIAGVLVDLAEMVALSSRVWANALDGFDMLRLACYTMRYLLRRGAAEAQHLTGFPQWSSLRLMLVPRRASVGCFDRFAVARESADVSHPINGDPLGRPRKKSSPAP